MGDYDLTVDTGDKTIWTGQSFRVDEYRLPTMRVTIAGPRQAQVKPKTVPLDLFVGYLSGGGASRLPVSLRIGWRSEERRVGKEGVSSVDLGGRRIMKKKIR